MTDAERKRLAGIRDVLDQVGLDGVRVLSQDWIEFLFELAARNERGEEADPK